MSDLLSYLVHGWFEECPYCRRGFTYQQWTKRDRESGGHDPCR